MWEAESFVVITGLRKDVRRVMVEYALMSIVWAAPTRMGVLKPCPRLRR